MAAKTSKEVTDRQKNCHFLITTLVNPRIAEKLADRMRPVLEADDADPFSHPMQVGLARTLDANMVGTVNADEALFRVEARLELMRVAREEAKRQVMDQIMDLRKILQGLYVAPRLNHKTAPPRHC